MSITGAEEFSGTESWLQYIPEPDSLSEDEDIRAVASSQKEEGTRKERKDTPPGRVPMEIAAGFKMTTSTTAAEELSEKESIASYFPGPDNSEEDVPADASSKKKAPGRNRKATTPDRARMTSSLSPDQLLLINGTASRRQPKKPVKSKRSQKS